MLVLLNVMQQSQIAGNPYSFLIPPYCRNMITEPVRKYVKLYLTIRVIGTLTISGEKHASDMADTVTPWWMWTLTRLLDFHQVGCAT